MKWPRGAVLQLKLPVSFVLFVLLSLDVLGGFLHPDLSQETDGVIIIK